MRTYENKDELKNEINKSFAKYISEFDIIPESLKDKRVEEVDRTPAENLAYQVGWTTLVLKWESDERNGLHVKTPSDDFKWNQLGELYQWFTDTYACEERPPWRCPWVHIRLRVVLHRFYLYSWLVASFI